MLKRTQFKRTQSSPALPTQTSAFTPQRPPRADGANPTIAIDDLKRCGHTPAVAEALVKLPGYLATHTTLFLRHGNPLADDADLSGLFDPLCAVCSAWLEQAYVRESSVLLNQLLKHYPKEPAAHELLKAHAHRLLGGVSHGASAILAAIETCALQDNTSEKTCHELIELANHLDPLIGLKLELAHLRQRIKAPRQPGLADQEFDPAQKLLELYVWAQTLSREQPAAETLLALADDLVKEIESSGRQSDQNSPLRRIASLQRRRQRARIDQLRHQMLSWLKLSMRFDTGTQKHSLDLQACLIAVPSTWAHAETNTAWDHFVQWTAWQLEDPQGLPWAALEPLVPRVASALNKKDVLLWLDQLLQLASRESLPIGTRRELLLSLIRHLRSIDPGLRQLLSIKAHAECLRAICALSEAAPTHCAELLEAYCRKADELHCINHAFKELVRLLIEVLSHPQAPDRDTLVKWTRAYATLSLRPDGSAWALWRALCQPLLKRWIGATRHNPYAHELFLQALRTLSMPQSPRSPLLNAVPAQADLLLDQWAHLPTPQERVRWLLQLDRLCAQNAAQQDLGDSTPAARSERHRLTALRGTIRYLLGRDQAEATPGLSGQGSPVDPAIAFFEQWAALTLPLGQHEVSTAMKRLEALNAEHTRLCAPGPRFSDGLDHLVGQLMVVQKSRFERERFDRERFQPALQ